eukprot:s120_g26.t1
MLYRRVCAEGDASLNIAAVGPAEEPLQPEAAELAGRENRVVRRKSGNKGGAEEALEWRGCSSECGSAAEASRSGREIESRHEFVWEPNLQCRIGSEHLLATEDDSAVAPADDRKGGSKGEKAGDKMTKKVVWFESCNMSMAVSCVHVNGSFLCLLAGAAIPTFIAAAVGMGRMIALQQPSGGVRGLVVGDLLRRLVARSVAQHYARDFDAKCHPYQYALSTRAGTAALIHTLQPTTELDPNRAIFLVDGIGAYDHVSRASMLQGLLHTPNAQAALPFFRQLCSQPSIYLWTDDNGHVHRITQVDGGEQCLPFSLWGWTLLSVPSNTTSFQE